MFNGEQLRKFSIMKEKFKIKWDDSLATGIQEIDGHHKDVINSVNDLYIACEENRTKDEILELIKILDYYIDIHFEAEENYAKTYRFKKNEELFSSHRFFRNIYKEIKNYYTIHYPKNIDDMPKYRYIHMFALHLNQTLVEWLNVHLNTIDRELSEFLKAKIT